ncbi:transposase [Paenibacillus sp. GXUN7292]|uniref:transposase n=1 Tax=Paenibacillus sp. GXUN7292 TaxID=3422499 RepID=UPI003D7E31F8
MVCDEKTIVKTLLRLPYLRGRDGHSDQGQKVKLVKAWRAFQKRFASESACYDYLFYLKWPNGYLCPRCSHDRAVVITTRRMPLYQCRCCHHQTTLTAGTIMEGSRTPLRKWLSAFFFLSFAEIGVNALQMQTLLQVTYKTAWSICQKIRQAISQLDADQPLSGLVTKENFRASASVSAPVPISISDSASAVSTAMFASNYDLASSTSVLHFDPVFSFESKSDPSMAVNHLSVRDLCAARLLMPASALLVNPEPPLSLIPAVLLERDSQERSFLVGASLGNSGKPEYVKIKLIAKEHIEGRRLLPLGIRLFEERHVKKGTSVEHSTGMPYRKRRCLQNIYDNSMGRLKRTYGSLGPKYLQTYLDECCYYYNIKAKGRLIFEGLSQLSMASVK